MGEVSSDAEQVNCVFDPNRECPVRKEMRLKLDAKKELSKYVQPLGDKELLKIFSPLIEKLERSFQNEFAFLHFYCVSCPIIFKEMV